MYRQIVIHPEDRRLQRILWKRDDRTLEYELNTVTYGLACAPYLAIRVLRQLAADEEGCLPRAADVLRQDTYMDDILTGADNLESSCHLREQVATLCLAGGFPLRKWAANDECLLRDVPLEHRLQPSTIALLPSDVCSVLGLRWNPIDDVFALTVRRSVTLQPTKRSVLSQSARLFDPLGWLAPIIVRAKLLIQAAWLQQLDWNVPLAAAETAAWTNLEEELPLLERIRVPQWFRVDASRDLAEIHGFSDASERAYAAVIYLRTTVAGEPHLSLVMAKSKVAPLKRISLPRLELCAASLLARLTEHVRGALHLEAAPVYLWTDSTVTLGWIRGEWHPFDHVDIDPD